MNWYHKIVKLLAYDHFFIFRPFRHAVFLFLCFYNRILLFFIRCISLKSQEEVKRTQGNAGKYVFLSRNFNQSNISQVRNLVLNFQKVYSGKLIHIEKQGNTLFGNHRWVLNQIVLHKPSNLVIFDPQLLGLTGPIGLIRFYKLLKNLDLEGIRLHFIFFDLLDPQGVIFSSLASRLGIGTIFTGSTGDEAFEFFGILNSTGPCLESMISNPSFVNYTNYRSIDLHLPRPSYEPRKSFVTRLVNDIESYNANNRKKITYTVGGSFPNFESLQESLTRTKIVVVTNSIINGVIGRFPRPNGPLEHVVSYNAEALAAGSLLFSQKCKALESVLVPDLEYVPFSLDDNLLTLLMYFLENERWQQIAMKGNQKFFKLQQEQFLLKEQLL